MARIRTVKPEHWNDKDLPKIPMQAHLLWIGMWNFSDDKGVIEADPVMIKSHVFPRRSDVRLEQVTQWLDQLVNARFIVPFVFENESYYVHRTFGTHQRIDKPQSSKIPLQVITNALNSKSNPRTIPPYSSVGDSKGEDAPAKIFSVDEKVDEILKSESWLNDIAKKQKVAVVYAQKTLKEFLDKESLKEEFKDKGIKDIKDHFVNYIFKVKPAQNQASSHSGIEAN